MHTAVFVQFCVTCGFTLIALVDHLWILFFNTHIFSWLSHIIPSNINAQRQIIGVFMAITFPMGIFSYLVNQKKKEGYSDIELYEYVHSKIWYVQGVGLALGLVFIKVIGN